MLWEKLPIAALSVAKAKRRSADKGQPHHVRVLTHKKTTKMSACEKCGLAGCCDSNVVTGSPAICNRPSIVAFRHLPRLAAQSPRAMREWLSSESASSADFHCWAGRR